MNNAITKLNARQRMDMVMKGLNPRDENEINRYLNGGSLSEAEKIERAKTLFEGANNLGGSKERDINPESLVGREFSDVSSIDKIGTEDRDFRKGLKEDMNDYGHSAGKVFDTDDFVVPRNRMNEQEAVGNIKEKAFNTAKQYLNAFMINLQSPSYKSRLEIFKSLKTCLELEGKYKNNPAALKLFREGVHRAEIAMLKKLG